MSHSYRHPPGAQPFPPSNMIPSSRASASPIGVSTNTSNFGFVTAPQQQFVIHPVMFPPQGMNNRISSPSNFPGICIPVVQGSAQARMVSDPARLLEERRKLEKERNFQMQQQRLKQFTVAGKKGSINADNLIDSMFGKIEPRRNSFGSSFETIVKKEGNNSSISSAPQSINSSFACNESASINGATQNSALGKSPSVPTSTIKDRKELDVMMLECSNLAGPLKAKTFHKPSVKELPPSSHHAATFATSDKARDWRNVQGLNNVFTFPKQRFPPWCCKEGVPELYHKVEAFVTENGRHGIDNSLLLPVLMSSGLTREALGQIWEVVNKTDPSGLTAEEMYAALALIAVAQNGHQVNAPDILHRLPTCPTPQLPNFMKFMELDAYDTPNEPVNKTADGEPENVSPCSSLETSTHKVVRPTAIALSHVKQPGQPSSDTVKTAAALVDNVQSWKPFENLGFVSSPDDDFDDFKSATPTAVNVAISTPTDIDKDDDDFDDFKQAPLITPHQALTKKQSTQSPHPNPLQEDLMSPDDDDKYSAFRLIQEDTADWGDFSSGPLNSQEKCVNVAEAPMSSDFTVYNSSVSEDINGQDNKYFLLCNNKEVDVQQAEDEFGDFLQAKAVAAPSIALEQDMFVADFADFDKQNEQHTEYHFDIPPDFQRTPSPKLTVEEYIKVGRALMRTVSPATAAIAATLQFKFGNDNISLTETQSVSSLELVTFDSGLLNDESKSSLSRQGSIPSLDLKVVGLDIVDSDDCFGEMQSATVASKSPSPSKDLKESENKNLSNVSSGFLFQPSPCIPLVDKYSVIRSEQIKEDQHITDWIRCVQSCLNILENSKRTFNQMSCSSVCNEVINSEEGENYVKNVIEVYKVVCRISLTSKSLGKQTEKLQQLIKESDQAWNTMCGFFAGSSLMPGECALDFSSGTLRPDSESNLKACGLCLLNVDARCKAFDKPQDTQKLSYGGRSYHSTCANLWVNCVDPLLPALVLPQLL